MTMRTAYPYSIVSKRASFEKAKAYLALWKSRLSLLVTFSAGCGYLCASPLPIQWGSFIPFLVGGFLASGAAAAFNQAMEQHSDKAMRRTCMRPLPSGRLSSKEAYIFAFLTAIGAYLLLFYSTNLLTAGLAMCSMLLYVWAYTPLKKVGVIAVVVGAIPGAMPPLLGWSAATGTLEYPAFLLFSLQFIWQFPHFWAIAWVSDEDYQRAGFKLLPASKKGLKVALIIAFHTLLLLPLGVLPTAFGLTGMLAAGVSLVAGGVFFMYALQLLRTKTRQTARRFMFLSFLYLPIVQSMYVIDRIW